MDELTTRRRTYFIHNMRWFWPVAENSDDVQRLSLIGYWVCVFIAIQNIYSGFLGYLAAQTPMQHGLAIFVTVFTIIFFFLAAIGSRIRNMAAAAMMVALEMSNVVEERVADRRLPIGTCLLVLLLLIVWRGIYLAVRWEEANGAAVSEPLYYNIYFGPSAMDGWAPKIWARFRVVFWILGAMLVGLNLVYLYFVFQDPSVR